MSEDHVINLQPGDVIGGKYEVERCLGTGSMGSVYACRHRELQELVAIKVLFPEVALDAVAAARFKNEIRASYRVSHPNVVRAYEYITDHDLVAYTMEYVGGGDLAEKLNDDRAISVGDILKYLSQMAAGCQAIHDAGIVHRDLKPENILLTDEGNVKIGDFGIARNRHGPKLTEHGGVVGTIDYVAPEYMLKSQVDWRSDIYALGILGYEMLTGRAPYKGDSVVDTMTKRLKTDPEAPSVFRSDCPEALDRVILKAMQREPDNRYQSALEMFLDIQKVCAALGFSEIDPDSVFMPGQSRALPRGRGPTLTLEPDALARGMLAGKESRDRVTSGRALSARGGSDGWVTPVGSDSAGAVAEIVSQRTQVEGAARRSDPRLLEHSLSTSRVETEDSPYAAPEPLVSSAPGRSSRDARSSRTSRRRRSSGSLDIVGETQSRVGEVIALTFAAAVGIGCGFLFIKFFAPSLLSELSF